MKRKLIVLIFFLGITSIVLSQNKRKIDSLETLLKTTKKDTSRIDILNKLAILHYSFDLVKATKLDLEALALANKIGDIKRKAYCEKTHADILFYKGENKESEKIYNKVIKTMIELQENKGLGSALYGLAYLFQENGKIPEAVKLYQQSISAYEKARDKSGAAWSSLQIGVVLTNDNQHDLALEYLNKSLKVFQELKEPISIANNYARIGNVLKDQKKNNEAIEIYLKSLEIFTSIGHKRGIAVIYNNLAGVYSDNLDNKPLAIEYYEKALKIRTEIGDKNGVVIILSNLSSLYSEMRSFQKAREYIDKSNKMAKEIGFKEMIANNYKHYAILESRQENYKSAYENYVTFHSLNDSIFNSEKSKLVAEMNTKFETEKKEKEITILNQQKTLQQLELNTKKDQIRKQRFIIAGILVVLILIILGASLILRLYKQKKKANEIILVKNKNLEQANEEIRAQRDEIESQKNIVIKQKNEIEDIYEELTDSIVYAQRIQQAVLPMNEYLDPFLKEYFILSNPKNIVSGDFFWITKVKTWTLFCVADCTGHGVPGAFMSMLGIALLNEIVRQEDTTQAGHVLDQLRKRVIESLKQRGLKGEQQDGMDIAFCALNTETLEMHYAGANNPCWVVKSYKVESYNVDENPNIINITNFELYELKGDKMPIGIHPVMQPFTNHITKLNTGDIVYLMSDGYEDQFGGPHRKKFYAKNIKNMLTANSQLPMSIQKQILETTLVEWIGDGEQIDDITILGIKI